MTSTVRKAATLAFAVASFAVIGAGMATAAPGDPNEPIGPFEALSTCQHEGNVRVVNDGWNDYECTGAAPEWFLYRR
ncbi:hypothetical protein [Nocardia sp. NPDC052566]|uniref:hypothetical protein n=1 Tax=Nocardia sp. NPDC052566 TaxID=3364330 RepID=UPI0037CC2895